MNTGIVNPITRTFDLGHESIPKMSARVLAEMESGKTYRMWRTAVADLVNRTNKIPHLDELTQILNQGNIPPKAAKKVIRHLRQKPKWSKEEGERQMQFVRDLVKKTKVRYKQLIVDDSIKQAEVDAAELAQKQKIDAAELQVTLDTIDTTKSFMTTFLALSQTQGKSALALIMKKLNKSEITLTQAKLQTTQIERQVMPAIKPKN